jgi:hypothetical protein
MTSCLCIVGNCNDKFAMIWWRLPAGDDQLAMTSLRRHVCGHQLTTRHFILYVADTSLVAEDMFAKN